jgi:hypothetical protein
MKKSTLMIRKGLLPTLLALSFIMFAASPGTASFTPIIAQTNPTTTVYLDPPTVNGTMIDQEFNVSIMIRDAQDIVAWQAGLIFNPDLLECVEGSFKEGEFLSSIGPTLFEPGTINNTLGTVDAAGCFFLDERLRASGNGRLAYLTFKVKELGVSDLHLRDVIVSEPGVPAYKEVPINIIDVYTAIVDTIAHTVVMVSNSSGMTKELKPPLWIGSGFYDHAFDLAREEISFRVIGPYPGFSNVTIPRALLPDKNPDEWRIIIDAKPGTRTVTSNATHCFLYFTYASGDHLIQLTTRPIEPSTISIFLSSDEINLGESVTIGGGIDPLREGVNVTIWYKPSGGTWTALQTVITDGNGNYTHTWTPTEAGTYELKASWEGDPDTLSDESEPVVLKVKKPPEGINPYLLGAIAAVVIIVIALVVYFMKFRKPKEEEES